MNISVKFVFSMNVGIHMLTRGAPVTVQSRTAVPISVVRIMYTSRNLHRFRRVQTSACMTRAVALLLIETCPDAKKQQAIRETLVTNLVTTGTSSVGR